MRRARACSLREPADDREVMQDLAQLDIVPPRPYADHVGVDLRRLLALASSDPDVDLEAGLFGTARSSSAVHRLRPRSRRTAFPCLGRRT
jgi:hypothetical protein